MNCEYCEILQKRKYAELLYEDDEVAIVIKDLVSIPGQITIIPKEHFTILELVPDEILQKCAKLANKVSISIFETMGCHGTNILIQNGTAAEQKVPHFAVEVIPRRENDNLNLQWNPKELSEDEKETTYLLLKEEGDKLVDIGKKKKAELKVEMPKEQAKLKDEDGKDNYLIKNLRRRP